MDCEQFVVDVHGWIWQGNERMALNVTHVNDVRLLEGKYEKSGFGMTPFEKEVAAALREQGWLR
jgi:hypothetical protein